MITRRDLMDAIEKCQGQRNPNANTCIKLAAYLVILDHTPEETISRSSDSEFMDVVKRMNVNDMILILDDMMEELQGVNPKLYYETMERLQNA